MKQRSYSILNVPLLGLSVVVLFFSSLFVDLILPIDLIGRHVTPGLFVNVIGSSLRTALFYHLFFRRLAQIYPDRKDELGEAARLITLPDKWRKRQPQISTKESTMVMQIIQGEYGAERINQEWIRGLRWNYVGMIGALAHLPILICFSPWIEAGQNWLWPYFHIFGR